jgi:hypothetical protein
MICGVGGCDGDLGAQRTTLADRIVGEPDA